MPDKDVRTVRDIIYYQYAKIIARRAFTAENGEEAKKKHYGFIKTTFNELKSCKKKWSEITREDWQLIEMEKECVFCGSKSNLSREHIVPKSLRINPRCTSCDTIQGIHNQIWSCMPCNNIKSTKGLYEFYRVRYPTKNTYYDIIPPLLEKKYLKTIYNCHVCAETLDKGDIDGDDNITVLDIDFILKKYCGK
jgi:hypothetical protein